MKTLEQVNNELAECIGAKVWNDPSAHIIEEGASRGMISIDGLFTPAELSAVAKIASQATREGNK